MSCLVCLSAEPWRTVPNRTQHIMTRLKGVDVLFFEPAPPLFGKTKHQKAYQQPGRRVRENLTVYTLPPILPAGEDHPVWERWNDRRLAAWLKKRLAAERKKNPVLWVCSPAYARLAELIPRKGLVYDCDQDWVQLPERLESELAYNADVVFAASAGLVDHLAPCNTNVALVPNGVVYPMFARGGLDALPFPADLVSIRTPILGYAGTLWEDLDLTPVQNAAKARPEWSFLFVGRVKANPLLAELQALPNVHFLGQKPVSILPEYVTRFDVCLSFVRLDRRNYDVFPPRFYEYLATGKPIVSMGVTGQDEEYPDVIYTAYTPAHFISKCEEALRERNTWNVSRRQDYAAAAAWSSRAEQVQRILVGNSLL